MGQRINLWVLSSAVMLGSMVSVDGYAWAEQASCTDCAVLVTATVQPELRLDVAIRELIDGGQTIGPEVTDMHFGPLASHGTFDPDGAGPLAPRPRALNSTKAFQVFFGMLNQGRPYSLDQTATSLRDGANTLPDGAFIVTPLVGEGGDPSKPLPAGTMVGTRGTAASNRMLFSAGGGDTKTMAVTYGITDDPALGATEGISPNQPPGNYQTQVVFTATAN